MCIDLYYSSSVTKPYSWDIGYTWNAQYTTVSTPSALQQLVSEEQNTTLNLDTEYLLQNEILNVSLTITNPFTQTVTSEVLSLEVLSPASKPYPCSPLPTP